MKTKTLFLVIGVTALIFGSCKSQKPIAISEVNKEVEVTLPFSGKNYKSDEKMMREVATGKSPDLATSKKIAMTNAITELGERIRLQLKSVRDNYTNQRTISDRQEFENKFEELTRIAVDQTLRNMNVIEEKAFEEEKGIYNYWVAVEISKQDLLDVVSNKLSADEKLNLDYDKFLFEKTFKEEMKNFKEQ